MFRWTAAGLVALLCLTWGSARVLSQEEQPEEAGLTVHQVLPSTADSRIDTFSGDGFQHWSWVNLSVPDKGQLVVFLPGTGGKGKGSGKFNKRAAHWGYHVVSLAYPDVISISWFKRSDDRDAMEKARRNVIEGKVPFAGLKVNQPNSIENRLVTMLRYLSSTFPQEHWDQFLDGQGQVAWDKLILTGQSQGGGHAAYMAMKMHRVSRVICFGSPKDFNRHFHSPAYWFSSGPSLTPLNRIFCFNHTEDSHNGCTYPQELEIYKAMKLSPGYPVVDVDQAQAPYEHSRLLTSTAKQGDPHNAPLHNEVYAGVWKYLLSEPTE